MEDPEAGHRSDDSRSPLRRDEANNSNTEDDLAAGFGGPGTLLDFQHGNLPRQISEGSELSFAPSPRHRSLANLAGFRQLRRKWPWQWWRLSGARTASSPSMRPAAAAKEPDEGWCLTGPRFSSFGEAPLEMRWDSLRMASWQVVGGKRKTVEILKGVSGTAKAGQLTCILGPSGSGKTTLLNVLAGRQSSGQRHGIRITGQVWAGGHRIDPRAVRSRIAYVMQKDEMFATATPREALMFSAALRLTGPRDDRTHEQREKLISELLGSLGLLKCADTCIGNAVINGLSGGQRKRTAIGVELITRPDIVCLDEPTSGLDSYAAYHVVRVLKDLASAGCTVVCTMHQPSSEIFALVDHVLCLCSGACLYEGAREQMVSHLAKVGFNCPAGFNPADYVIFLMQTEPQENLSALMQDQARRTESDELLHGRKPPKTPIELCRTPHGKARWLSSDVAPNTKSCGTQLNQLIRREFRAAVRDRTTMAVRFCLSFVLAFLFGLVFQGVGRTILEEEETGVFDMMWSGLTQEEISGMRQRKLEWHFNALVQVALVAMFSACQPVMLTFPLERPVFLREVSSGAYTVLPYYLSKMAVEVPLVFIQSLLTLSLCYVVMCLNGDFLTLLLTVVLLSVCSVAVALAIGCSVRQPRETGAMGPLIFVPQMLFSGVFIPVSRMPYYLRWMQYGSFLQYAIKVLGVVEFRNVPHKQVLLAAQDIDEGDVWEYVGLLVLLVLLFSVAGIQMLRTKAKHLF